MIKTWDEVCDTPTWADTTSPQAAAAAAVPVFVAPLSPFTQGILLKCEHLFPV